MFSHTSQPCQFERDCAVVMIPSGDELTMPAGTVGYITQSLGGSFTVFIDGNLFRVAGIDADAIGKEPPDRIFLHGFSSTSSYPFAQSLAIKEWRISTKAGQ